MTAAKAPPQGRRRFAPAPSLLFLARALRRGGEELAVTVASRQVAARAREHPGVAAGIEFVYGFDLPGFDVGLAPIQVPGELRQFLEIVGSGDARPLRAVLEIGTARGGTLFLLAAVAADDAIVISIDLPQGRFGGGYAPRRARIYRRFARPGQTVRLFRLDSHDPGTRERVVEALHGRELDLLLVDGDHTRDGLLADLRMYSGMVAAGGYVGLHDIVPGAPEHVGGGPAVWEELRALPGCVEIVENPAQGGYGIGLIRKATPAGTPLTVPPSA